MSSVGRASKPQAAGITLIEMLVVTALVGILAAISYPSVTTGLDSLRLNSAVDSVAGFLNAAMTRADRSQQVVEVSISKSERYLSMRSAEPGFTRRLNLPAGISIVAVHPEIDVDPHTPRQFMLYPGGVVPRVGIEIANQRGVRRIVRIDPITGVPQIERPEAMYP